jgi:hypothetical protein
LPPLPGGRRWKDLDWQAIAATLPAMGPEITTAEAVERFIVRWQGREGGQERANYVSFLNELIALLGLRPPDPADATHEHNDYVFERAVKQHRDHGESQGGSTSTSGSTSTRRTASFSKPSRVA